MAKTYTIKVTQGRIKRGNCRNIKNNPVAIAFRAVGLRNARVGHANWWVEGSTRYFEPLPVRIANWLRCFDAGLPVKPITFKVKI